MFPDKPETWKNILVATLSGNRCYEVIARTDWPDVSTLSWVRQQDLQLVSQCGSLSGQIGWEIPFV